MKILGKKISGPNIEICVIPRGEEVIVFHAQAVLDMTPFEGMCPRPKPPTKIIKGGKRIDDFESPQYQILLDKYAQNRVNYMILKSLQATEGLEWESVDLSNVDTWGNYNQELKDSGFSEIEVMRIVNSTMIANCLSEDKLEEARSNFLASQQAGLEE